MAEQFSIPTVGDLVAGKYRVEEELGRGAYGVVFRADQEELGRHVAVKTLLPQAFLQQDIVQRFHREAQLISRLDHPNIIRLYDYGVDEGLLYMAVEYVEGRTLMDIIENDAPLEPARVRDLALQILDALEHAHQHGIVHRDLKPDNIVLLETKTSDGREFEVVKILDFGISKLLQGDEEKNALKSLTQDGTVLGTPHYMSPENIVGDPVDHRADLYAFGVIVYEMLTGAHPFDAPSPSAVMVRHLRDEPEPLPEEFVGTPVGAAITRSLEKQPWDRIESARDLIEILESTTEVPMLKARSRPMSGPRKPSPVKMPELSVDETVVDEPRPSSDSLTVPWPVLVMVLGVCLVLAVSIGWQVWVAVEAAREESKQQAVAHKTEEPRPTESKQVEPKTAEKTEKTEESEEETASAADAGAGTDTGLEALALEADEPSRPPPPKQNEKPPPRKDDGRTKEKKQAPPPRRDPPRAASAQSNAEETFVELSISSVPTDASVTIDGTPVGTTPLKHSVSSGEPINVRFSHIGYKEKLISLTPTAETRTIRARLEKDQLRLVD